MKVVFAGTPEFAVPVLQALVDSTHDVVGVYTMPDRPAGRGRRLQPSPVKSCALSHGLAVYQPSSFKAADAQAELASLQADVMVVVGFGMLLPEAVLQMPKHGCLNIHPSLLPKWRGASPVQASLLACEEKTGVTVMKLVKAMDAGPICFQQEETVRPLETAGELYARLFAIGADLLLQTLHHLEQDQLQTRAQDDALATFCQKIEKSDAKMDWNKSARELEFLIRALNPTPVAHAIYKEQPIRIWLAQALSQENVSQAPGTIVAVTKEAVDIATGQGVLRLMQVQLPGKKQMSIRDFINSQQSHLIEGQVCFR